MSDRMLILTGIGAVLALAVVGWAAAKKAGAVAGDIVQAVKDNADLVNPASDQNLIYRGAGSVVDAVRDVASGQSIGTTKAATGDSLGTWLYNVTHPNEFKDLNKGTQPFYGDLPTY